MDDYLQNGMKGEESGNWKHAEAVPVLLAGQRGSPFRDASRGQSMDQTFRVQARVTVTQTASIYCTDCVLPRQ